MKRINNHHLFDIKVVHRDITPGCLLVSEPFLREDYFNHAVILLADYNRHEGAMGVVLNNRLEGHHLQGLISGIKTKKPIEVFCGGPVNSDRLFFIHTLPEIFPDGQEISPGLFIGGDFDSVVDYINSGYPLDETIRFFVGYSGWSPAQLEAECVRNVWAVTPNFMTPSETLTGAEDSYWHKVVRRMGPPYSNWLLHPKNPSFN